MTATEHTQTYWRYQYDVSANSIAPLLQRWGLVLEGASVIDVGCGEGGGLCALHDRGAHCVGFDVDEPRIHAAMQMRGDRRVEFATGNLYQDPLPFGGTERDLVVLHDVFEHLDRKPEMIEKLKRLMKPAGRLLITFPPYYSAYGAHQQHLRSSVARIPFFHLLPFSVSFLVPRLRREAPEIVEEVQKLGRLRMGMRKFEGIAAAGGLRIEQKEAYLISPNHIRFGLKPIPAGPVSRLPVISELFCTGVVYFLSKD
jgi:SAM-dependent methyltransferase